MQNDCCARLQRVHQGRVVAAGQNQDALILAGAEGLKNLSAFGVVRREVAEQHKCGIDFFTRALEGFYYSFWIFPRIKTRNLHHQWQIGWNLIVREALVDFVIA